MFGFFRRNTYKKPGPGEPPVTEPQQQPPAAERTSRIPLVEVIPRDIQQTIRGTRKRFLENLEYNLSLLAERLPGAELVGEHFSVGSLSKRKVALVYLKNKANPGIVSAIRERIQSIKAETVLDSSYIERNLENDRVSPFPQLETSLRPDVAESALLQGRIAVLVDGSPEVLLAPASFFDLMDIPSDAYSRWYVAASFFRIARYIMFGLAISLPGLYIALTSYNPELIPNSLLLLMLASREDVPFPIYFEAFAMMGVVEAIRMMMLRMPSNLGATIALFSGIALVGAGLAGNYISASVVIIVTLTMVSSFGIPNYDLRSASRMIQFFTMFMASFLGLFGFAVALFYIGIHLATLKSFGIPYLAPLAPAEASGWGHTILRESTVAMPRDETYKPRTLNNSAGDNNE
ncbi:spore germination protein KA [Desulfotomaculum arcticum]|uniref:Spore germination protein KA n=1 Tax=Desulfotruncus arcticus DSM 17038 TaxID=1121424 RepID=A0A1I2P1C7_9FIRM|nr:spore germination protein [Desulfotruncus arcticus]SFG09170.1 spore germination protein KA [Desulfotomaculum arcticum] [Desulfotruncus arcticus DSM 17038]